ncbi:MAG: cytochrome c oxidase subunit II [Arenimonas sp.]
MKTNRITAILTGLMASVASLAVFADDTKEPQLWQLNMTDGVTASSQNAYDSHMLMFWVCVVIGIIVFGAMGIAMFKFRKSKGAVPDTNFTHSTLLEVLWTGIPIIILIASAIPATGKVMELYNANHSAKPYEMTIKVTGQQWLWSYEYKGEGLEYTSRLDRESDRLRQDPTSSKEAIIAHKHYLRDVDNPLVIPADTRVRFVITADDVIHAWWVPALGWKQDAIPGVINEAWTEVPAAKIGTYRGVCAELCGKDHGFMPIVVKVVSKADYKTWLAAKKAANNPTPVAATEAMTVEDGEVPAEGVAEEAAIPAAKTQP